MSYILTIIKIWTFVNPGHTIFENPMSYNASCIVLYIAWCCRTLTIRTMQVQYHYLSFSTDLFSWQQCLRFTITKLFLRSFYFNPTVCLLHFWCKACHKLNPLSIPWTFPHHLSGSGRLNGVGGLMMFDLPLDPNPCLSVTGKKKNLSQKLHGTGIFTYIYDKAKCR